MRPISRSKKETRDAKEKKYLSDFFSARKKKGICNSSASLSCIQYPPPVLSCCIGQEEEDKKGVLHQHPYFLFPILNVSKRRSASEKKLCLKNLLNNIARPWHILFLLGERERKAKAEPNSFLFHLFFSPIHTQRVTREGEFISNSGAVSGSNSVANSRE